MPSSSSSLGLNLFEASPLQIIPLVISKESPISTSKIKSTDLFGPMFEENLSDFKRGFNKVQFIAPLPSQFFADMEILLFDRHTFLLALLIEQFLFYSKLS